MLIEKLPVHVLVYEQLREMILYGDLAPGQAVTIQGLVKELGAGMTPVREAIRRLTSEGALEFLGNRRVCVPRLAASQLDQLAFTRLALEPELAFRAARNIDADAISALETVDGQLNEAIDAGDVRGYMECNYRFHATLYACSGADILISVVDGLWLRAAPSLRVMCGRFGTRNLPDMHEEAIAALRSGRHDDVAEAIRRDITQGIENIRATFDIG